MVVNPKGNRQMIFSIVFSVVLCLALVIVIVAPLVWAIRTAHHDVPAGSAKARLEAGATLVRSSRRPARRPAPQPHLGASLQPAASPSA
jgi:hypothetical protein